MSDREDPFMPCFHPGCGVESTHSIARWVNPNHMAVDYYCEAHAPEGATSFEEDDAEAAREDAEAEKNGTILWGWIKKDLGLGEDQPGEANQDNVGTPDDELKE